MAYRKAKLSNNFRVQLRSLGYCAIFAPHVNIFALNEVIADDLRDTPLDEKSRNIWRHLDASTDLQSSICFLVNVYVGNLLTSPSSAAASNTVTSHPARATALRCMISKIRRTVWIAKAPLTWHLRGLPSLRHRSRP